MQFTYCNSNLIWKVQNTDFKIIATLIIQFGISAKQNKLNLVEITKLLWAKFWIRKTKLGIKETLPNEILEDITQIWTV